MARILLVGTATLDLVFELDHYPHADEEMRAYALRTVRGGNAANSAIVLSQLGHAAEFVGALAQSPETSVITEDFERHGVAYGNCLYFEGKPPTSSIYLSGDRRSIVHYRDLPELPGHAATALIPQDYDWAHFEGRNIESVQAMILSLRSRRPELPISIELEKPRAGIEALFGLADLLVCSQGFAEYVAGSQARDFLGWMQLRAPQARIILAAGREGAYGLDIDGIVHHAPAMPPTAVVDTLGAGDTFNAGLLDAAMQNLPMPLMLDAACRLAGRKCGIVGFELGPRQ